MTETIAYRARPVDAGAQAALDEPRALRISSESVSAARGRFTFVRRRRLGGYEPLEARMLGSL
jgi:hypothetical protein